MLKIWNQFTFTYSVVSNGSIFIKRYQDKSIVIYCLCCCCFHYLIWLWFVDSIGNYTFCIVGFTGIVSFVVVGIFIGFVVVIVAVTAVVGVFDVVIDVVIYVPFRVVNYLGFIIGVVTVVVIVTVIGFGIIAIVSSFVWAWRK